MQNQHQDDSSPQPLLLRIPEVAERLRLSRAMIYILIHRNAFPIIRIGRAVRVSSAALQKWVQEREKENDTTG